MIDEMTDAEIGRRTDAMRGLGEDDRRDAIDAAPNCLGYDRFQHRAKQVALRDAYRKPGVPK